MITNLIKKRIYWYCDNVVYRVCESGFIKVEQEEVTDCRYALCIVSRKHYKETYKQYPIVDRADLNGIINNEFPDNAIRFVHESSDHNTLVKVWTPDASVCEFLTNAQSVWVPETIVLEAGTVDGELVSYQLSQHQLFLFKQGPRVYSTLSKGTFSAPNNFLLSIGADIDAKTVSKDETRLATDLLTGIFNIRKTLFVPIMKAQMWGAYLNSAFHWPSVLLGVFGAVALYIGANFAYLNMMEGYFRDKIEQQQLHLFVKKEKQLEKQIALLEQVQASGSGASGTEYIWELVAHLVSNDISVLRLQREGGDLTVRLEAKSAAESLEFVQSLAFVAKAQLASSVARSRGNQRFNLDVQFGQGGTNE